MFRPATSSLFSLELRASQWTVVKGLLNDEFRAASTIELNMMMPKQNMYKEMIERNKFLLFG